MILLFLIKYFDFDLLLCSLLFINEVMKRDERRMFYLDRGGEEGSLEALRRLDGEGVAR